MSTPEDSLLGREVAYPRRYDPALLFPIARAPARAALGLGDALPFAGHDRWHAYELSWLDARGKPQVATATLRVPASTPHLVESKSLKLYLNSLNAERFEAPEAVRRRIADDLSRATGGPVAVDFGLPPMGGDDGAACIDALEVDIDRYGPPDPGLLRADPGDQADEVLRSHLLKSNCPVTGQPDWATIDIAYRGPRIDRAALLRYLVSYREHAGFHEQCVEQVFIDLMARCAPRWLSVEARYTRRGGLDINPWRATPGSTPPAPRREHRQ
ncbi:NADPH-dependent 7-cyano-7-deazaguanine reductase QueF [Luteimonas wenzhouensis]|uniref:NADPH-dependent 7-cyano-7-deazaguanine reductase n=1 Tax=Luteimonas wenzhouensis TaxID=2599615 RepID=A0A5C5TXD4_9GAMM|nr:NADPH-dependent 7-cyano-7-deazaguanine reductase QueF [Luteimonas wenzhouensis]TWT18317.1 NADPH-dependent 7-cyano-7-deazaguanine reductase QueF [Luteimonas wenzhouensis]